MLYKNVIKIRARSFVAFDTKITSPQTVLLNFKISNFSKNPIFSTKKADLYFYSKSELPLTYGLLLWICCIKTSQIHVYKKFVSIYIKHNIMENTYV